MSNNKTKNDYGGPLKLYLAAPWADRELMPARADAYKAAGYIITHNWWEYDGAGEEFENEEFLIKCAVQDTYGVITADIVVVYNTAKSEGKATEQGIAIGRGIPIISIGTRGEHSKNIFHHLPLYHWVPTQEVALELLLETAKEVE